MAAHDPYNHIAPLYDTITAKALHTTRKRMVALCAALGAQCVLDVGCGTGVLLTMLQKEGIAAVGIDASFAMLRTNKNAHTPCILANAADLPCKRGAFDVGIYSLILHETDADAVALIHEGFLVARRLMVLEWHAPQRNLDYLYCLWPHAIERLAGKNHYRNFRAFLQQGGLAGLAYRAGATITHCERVFGNSMSLTLLEKP